MTSIVLAALFFIGIHIFVSGTRLRDVLAQRLGENGYLGLFSVLSTVGVVWLCRAYSHNSSTIECWDMAPGFGPVGFILLVVAFFLVGVGMTTPSPTAVVGGALLEKGGMAKGVLRITRHPALCGVCIWAFVHLVQKGDLASLIFFGTFLFVAGVGPMRIDARRERAHGEHWKRFAEQTSAVPFIAIIQGRNRLVFSELGIWRIALALVLFALAVTFHEKLFGVAAF
jgi:uncharacterized membrane protein